MATLKSIELNIMNDEAIKADIIKKADEVFIKYDKNHSGELDFAELTTALTEIYAQNGKPKPKFLELNDVLSSLDKNKIDFLIRKSSGNYS